MLPDNNRPTFSPVDGYRYYNYAMLHSRGYTQVFDTMRYDRAFLARRTDLVAMQEAAKNYVGKCALTPKATLLCRYDWKGKTRPNWTHDKLASNMELEIIDDPMALLDLNADVTAPRPTKTLKIRADLQVTGQLPWVLEVMYENQAMPSQEVDANRIEQAFYREYGDQEITVSLTNFRAVEADWILPPK